MFYFTNWLFGTKAPVLRKSWLRTQQVFLSLQRKVVCCPAKKCVMNHHHSLFFRVFKIFFVGKCFENKEKEKNAEMNTFYFCKYKLHVYFTGFDNNLKKSTLLLPVSKGMVPFSLILILAVM